MKMYAHIPTATGEVKIMFEGSFQEGDFDLLQDSWKQILNSAKGRARAESLMPTPGIGYTPPQPGQVFPGPDRRSVSPTYTPTEPKTDWTEPDMG